MSAEAIANLKNREAENEPDQHYRTRSFAISQRTGEGGEKLMDSSHLPSQFDNSTATDREPAVMDQDDDASDIYPDTSDEESFDPNDEASTSEDDTASYGVIVEEESFQLDIEDDVNYHPPNTEMMNQFKEYCSNHAHNFLPLSCEYITSIKLLDILKRKKTSLNTFEEVLEWHLKETNHLQEHETLKDTTSYFRRETIIKELLKRYDLERMLPKLKKLTLPFSKAVVTIPYRDAADCIASLLTDPRVQDDDYLFFDNNPLAAPPENVDLLNDLNTGDAYLKSYNKWITKPNQVALPIVFYIDGAVTGQFSSLPVTPLKIGLGIHNHQAREKEWAWRELAWIPQVRKEAARGKKLFKESNHMEADDIEVLDGEGDHAEVGSSEDTDSDDEDADPSVKAQDFHSMLQFALQSVVKLQESGFIWDLHAYGKKYQGLEFVPFVMYVKCDTEEGDLNCGKYLVRTSKVKHICRYCHCPTEDADNPMANYRMKTQTHIQKLVEQLKLDRLRSISQHNIKNAWYPLRFHAANERGIHGACPSEMLHAILLGIFKYVRNIFFLKMGMESQLAQDINGLAKQYGKLLTHQSDRDLPHTNFAKGIQKGKLMAKQFRGVLLIMAAVIRSTLGRKLLKKKKSFGKENGVRDWTLLVELLLEWEAYLTLKQMKKKDVKRLAKKHRYIMYIIKEVADRSKGMGLKLMKFHAIVHLVEDMLLYGVPAEFDTGSNESHHKISKVAAKLTQRKEATFNYQVAKRMTEFLVIDYAMEEVAKGKQLWEYFADWEMESDDLSSMEEELAADMEQLDVSRDDSQVHDSVGEDEDSSEPAPLKIHTGGTQIRIYEDEEDDDKPSFEILGRSKYKHKTKMDIHLIDWLNALQNLLWENGVDQDLPVLTEHRRGANVFRGHPNHRGGGPWRDWAIVDWGVDYGHLPSHICCFVRITGIPTGAGAPEFGGIRLHNGVFAVCEVAHAAMDDSEEEHASDLFTPLTIEVGEQDADGTVLERKLYLANTDAIVGPCAVIPDIGGAPNAYLRVKQRGLWAPQFVRWLRSRHGDDVIDACGFTG